MIKKEMGKKSKAIGIILNLTIAVFAFCVLIYNIDLGNSAPLPLSANYLGSYATTPDTTEVPTQGMQAVSGGPTEGAEITSWAADTGRTLGGYHGQGSYAEWLFGDAAGSWYSAGFSAIGWGVVAYFAAYSIAKYLFKTSEQGAQSIGLGAGLGTATGVYLYYYEATLWSGAASFGIGVAIAAVIIISTYRDTKTKTATFTCMPWQAPIGGIDCEKCNTGKYPCTEYRCRSLGQNCELLNAGTAQEKCASVNPKDVTPPVIYPNPGDLLTGYKYTDVKPSPPGAGFRIQGISQECVKPFTHLRFGITTNEPSQCKIDYNTTKKMDEMQYWMGGSSLYDYNHTEVFSLPGPASINSTDNPILNNGGRWTFFIRCSDKNGNENSAEYSAKFCVDPSPDTTPARIEATSIINQGCVAEKQDSADVVFYTNEPAECRWSFEDKAYDSMEKIMDCDTDISEMNSAQLYACRTTLTAIKKDLTPYYVRCKDQPYVSNDTGRNVNTESYVYQLKSSPALVLSNLKPATTQFGSSDPAPFYLEADTSAGCSDGKATCYYSKDNNQNYVQFFETGDTHHKQRQDLSSGTYTYFIKCTDVGGGNTVEQSVQFKVETTKQSQIVLRAFIENNQLKVSTLRPSQCSYSFNNCDFTMREGTEMPYANVTTHVTNVQAGKTYYIKCSDEFQDETSDCSIIVKPGSLSA